ncbi:hypothetical protein DF186_14845, partial [Enterococcus hirae]
LLKDGCIDMFDKTDYVVEAYTDSITKKQMVNEKNELGVIFENDDVEVNEFYPFKEKFKYNKNFKTSNKLTLLF